MIDYFCIFMKDTNRFFKINMPINLSIAENKPFFFYNSLFSIDFLYDIEYFIIPFLLITTLTFIFLLIINRYSFEKNRPIKKEIDTKIDNFLTEIVFSDYDIPNITEKIDFFKKEVPFNKKWCKKLILNKLITIKQNINGINPNQILLIYKCFELHHYSKKLILSKNSKAKSLGIYHYKTLEYKIKTGYIKPHLDNKNKFLRSNALIALITLSDEKFDFLSNYEEKISNADELKILDVIYQKNATLPKKINDWLYNKNSSIVILGIKLMVQYNETLSTSQIIYLLNNTNATIRRETLLAIRHLYIIDANDIIINYYPSETNKRNKISALKTLAVIGDNETIAFVYNILSEEKDLEIKFEIVNCINKIDSTFFDTNKTNNQLENEVIDRILLHANNPYLN